MKTEMCVKLLKHLLYLFIFGHFGGTLTVMLTSISCKNLFIDEEILPVKMNISHQTLYITVNTIVSVVISFSFTELLVNVVGFFGIIYIDRWPLINFVFGVCMLFTVVENFSSAYALFCLAHSLKKIFKKAVKDLFESSVGYKSYTINDPNINITKFFYMPVVSGWSWGCDGTTQQHREIDYMQINLRCCGLTGRDFWQMVVPRSCCSEKFQGYKCSLGVAYSKSCAHDFNMFIDRLEAIQSELITFGFIALALGMDCLYLAYLRHVYPDGDYKSDHSSDDDEMYEIY